MGQLHHLLQVDIAVRNNLKQMQVPWKSKYCKWILNELEKLQVPETPDIASGYCTSWKNYESPKHQILQVDVISIPKITSPHEPNIASG